MKQIRRGVFETNSSSSHSISICSESEFEKFEKGKLLYNKYTGDFVSSNPVDIAAADKLYDYDEDEFITYDEFLGLWDEHTYVNHLTTPGGEKIVVFGTYSWR